VGASLLAKTPDQQIQPWKPPARLQPHNSPQLITVDVAAFTEETPSHGQALSLVLNLPPLAVLILRPEG